MKSEDLHQLISKAIDEINPVFNDEDTQIKIIETLNNLLHQFNTHRMTTWNIICDRSNNSFQDIADGRITISVKISNMISKTIQL